MSGNTAILTGSLVMTFLKSFCEHMFSFLLDKYPGVELLRHKLSINLTL